MKYYAPILAALTLSIGGGALIASAQTYLPLAPLPGTVIAGTDSTDLSTYLTGMIKLLVALGGALAVVMLVIGGTQYVAAGINPSAKGDAKDRILNALIGLTLVLTSYLILNSINPNLVAFNLNLPAIGVSTTVPSGVTATGGTGACPSPLSALSSDAAPFESGATVSFSSNDSNVQQNLSKLQSESNKLKNAIAADYPGSSVVVNSAFRPVSYQKHLWEVWDKWKNKGLETNTDPDCADLKNEVGAEYSKHGLGSIVASPSACAPHVKGTAIDISVQGGPANINTYMSTKGIDLIWQGIPGDLVHFNLKNPPYGGCAAI